MLEVRMIQLINKIVSALGGEARLDAVIAERESYGQDDDHEETRHDEREESPAPRSKTSSDEDTSTPESGESPAKETS